MRIVGAGLAGLLAAHAWPQAQVFEAQSEPLAAHKALLRFRGEAVSQLTGIEFRKVTVRKGIWVDGVFVQPSIQNANWYAQKVTGELVSDRSIWNLDPVQRYIAPESFYQQLVEAVGKRITWGAEFDWGSCSPTNPIISTAPLPVVLKGIGSSASAAGRFLRAGIVVRRYRVAHADVFQTLYYPSQLTSTYRASITGSLLIVEEMEHRDGAGPMPLDEIAGSFGIDVKRLLPIESVKQHYGKIVPLEDALRKPLLHRLSVERGIFSLGRFATWRNILLDDVVADIAVIRRLLKLGNYERSLVNSQ